jgi:hypothetical protein
MYIEKRSRWKMIFDLGDGIQNKLNISEVDILNEVKIIRKK